MYLMSRHSLLEYVGALRAQVLDMDYFGINIWEVAYELRTQDRAAEAIIEILPEDHPHIKTILNVSNCIARFGPIRAQRDFGQLCDTDAMFEWFRAAIHHERTMLACKRGEIPVSYRVMCYTTVIALPKLNDPSFTWSHIDNHTQYIARMNAKLDTAIGAAINCNTMFMTLARRLPLDAVTKIVELVWPRLCPINVFVTTDQLFVGPFRIPLETAPYHMWSLTYMLIKAGFIPVRSDHDGMDNTDVNMWLESRATSYLPARPAPITQLLRDKIMHVQLPARR